MAPLATHLVIGERVYPQIAQFERTQTAYGSFLLGCLLPDVNAFSEIDRRETHFVGRPGEDGADAFTQSCTRFLERCDRLLRRPWDDLAGEERAFVAGYLCHLAADEVWKASAWRALSKLGMRSPAGLGVPLGVVTTASSVLSTELYLDFPAVTSALRGVGVPDVFGHVPHSAFVNMWQVLQPYALDGRTYGAYLKLLAGQGRSRAEVEAVRQEHERYWEAAVVLVDEMGGVEPAVRACVERAIEMVPRLWVET